MTPASVAALLLGLSTIPIAAWLIGITGSLPWWAPPTSVPLLFFAFVTHPAFAVGALPFLFWLWAHGLFRASTSISRPAVFTVAGAFALSGVWYITHAEDLAPTDPFANVAVLLVLSAFVGLSRKWPSFALHAAFRWLAFVWSLSYALPFRNLAL